MKEQISQSELLDRFGYYKTAILGGEEIDIYLEDLDFGKELTSNILHLPMKDSGKMDNYKIFIGGGEKFFADYQKDKRELLVVGDGNLISEELEFILYTYSEVSRNERGRFTFHAAAVAKENRGLLILGDKGVGKTSLALSLCRDFGYSLIGNDVLVLGRTGDGAGIFDGDGVFRLRRLSVDKYFGELAGFLKDSQASGYDHKVSLKPMELAVDLQKTPVEIDSAIQVFLNADEKAPLELGVPPQLQLKLNLMENASRYIRATATPLLGGENFEYKGGLPSFNNPDLFQTRAGVLEELMQEIGVVSVSGGNLREIARYANEYHVSR